MKLFLKGDRCHMAKCPIETQRPPPGMHGAARKRKTSDYGLQLREKQRLRRSYGLQEEQFRCFFDRAAKRRGLVGEALLQMLEMRLDNLVYRFGFAQSRRAGRQFVGHNHVLVNGRRATIPSMVLKPGDAVQVKGDAASREAAKRSLEAAEAHGFVSWLTLDKEKLSGVIVRLPSRKEIAPTINEQLVVELYSK